MDEVVSLQKVFQIIKNKKWLITGIVLLAIIASTVLNYFYITPEYEASTQILVNQKGKDSEYVGVDKIQANLQLINTYNVIIKSPVILTKVIEKLDLETTSEELTKQINVLNTDDSQVVNISVRDEDYDKAIAIANTVAEVFKSEIQILMNINNVNVLSSAQPTKNPTPVSPNTYLNITIAVVIGLIIGIGLAFILDYIDTTIKSEEYIEETLDLPIIGIVCSIPDNKSQKKVFRSRSRSF
ncbi:capsule biosynthesis protein [Lysinibacillus agricola]|uniref:Capsule biosynthesis protein n=1 Tax=Lysinibacillus agricola TaxID=2590012 RepID=A0ABX7AZS8_9BACI|nr:MULTISPECIES: Wzz/FepE/Etk N-terminal domain-containing protein [Lysinibacillus]KOS62730.1 hypothetical protein AN161_10425 [Lysinibacillus sp. FJAT-14222]QQP13699.1 capsule biosynthesis protein [Lysinibacillus agricola]